MGELFAGRYELVDPLGHGGMGAVWRCWDHRSQQYVAAKLLRQVDAMSLLRFVREQAFRIDHPHVVTPLSWAAEDDRVLYTMPVVRGGSVATLRNDFGMLPYRWVAVLVDQLLDALEAVHNAGVVHRDLKPANLLLEPTGQGRPHLRLSDFGIAAAVGEPRLTSPSLIVGTPGYVAPEQLRGAGPEPRQDLYAVGVVAADLLLGREESHAGPVAGSVTGPAPNGVPTAFWKLLGRLTAERPEDRPGGAAAARRELAEAGGVPTWSPVPPNGQPDDVEVFDHHPPLPPGWGPAGPVPPPMHGPSAYPGGQGTPTRSPGTQPITPLQATAQQQATPQQGGGQPTGPYGPPGGPDPTARQAAGNQTRTMTPPQGGQNASAGVAGNTPAQPGPPNGSPSQPATSSKRSRGGRAVRVIAWAATVAGLGLMAAGGFMLAG